MLHIGQPVKFNDGSLGIFLGVNMESENPYGESMILRNDGQIHRENSFNKKLTESPRDWTYSHILNSNGKLVYKMFSCGGLGFFGWIEEFTPEYEDLRQEMLAYLKELETETPK